MRISLALVRVGIFAHAADLLLSTVRRLAEQNDDEQIRRNSINMPICVKPISKYEIEISYDHDDPTPEVIPATNKAIREWVENIGGGNEIEPGYFMETDFAVLSCGGHDVIGNLIAAAVNEYNRPHTVAFWRHHHGEEVAARLEKKYFN